MKRFNESLLKQNEVERIFLKAMNVTYFKLINILFFEFI